ERLRVEPLIRCLRACVGIADQVGALCRTAGIGSIGAQRNIKRWSTLEPGDPLQRPASEHKIGSLDPTGAPFPAFANGQLVKVGEIENVVDIPTGARVVLPAIEGVLSLLAFRQRRLAVQ